MPYTILFRISDKRAGKLLCMILVHGRIDLTFSEILEGIIIGISIYDEMPGIGFVSFQDNSNLLFNLSYYFSPDGVYIERVCTSSIRRMEISY